MKTVTLLMAVFWISSVAHAEDAAPSASGRAEAQPRIVYPKSTKLDFEGVSIDGELKNPAEFYFERREQEKFDSLVKRRKNFHREMLRDAVLSR